MEVMAREARLQQRRLQPALHANLGCSVSLQDLTSPTGPGNLERHCTHASKNLLPPLKPASSAAATSRRMRQGPLCMMSGPGRAGQRKHRLVPAASTLCLRLVSPRMLPCRQKGMQATQKVCMWASRCWWQGVPTRLLAAERSQHAPTRSKPCCRSCPLSPVSIIMYLHAFYWIALLPAAVSGNVCQCAGLGHLCLHGEQLASCCPLRGQRSTFE